ncbi:MAG TPA: hypothetical protein VHB51_02205 [Candidatus Saccharimonadales bacterium]|nr:hypothetical protein [Candidatus Saccharimonadales bacterium]
MIDQLMNRRAMSDPLQPNHSYHPNLALASTEVLHPSAESNGKLEVMFSAWHHSPTYYGYEANRQAALGTTVLTLISDPQVIEPNPHRVLKSYKFLTEAACAAIDTAAKDFDTVHFLGASSGIVALSSVAGQMPDQVNSATIIAGGHSLTDSVWFGARTRLLREVLVRQGWKYEELAELWDPLATRHASPTFQSKPVQFFRSLSDRNVPPQSQKAYADELRTAGAVLDERVTRLGHYASIGLRLRKGF